MINVINEYISKISLQSDDITKNLLIAAIDSDKEIVKSNVFNKAKGFVVDIKVDDFSVDLSTTIMNKFMCKTKYPYSSMVVRFNEGSLVRFKYASCKENREGFACDVIISSV